jgi:hypothetical protein
MGGLGSSTDHPQKLIVMPVNNAIAYGALAWNLFTRAIIGRGSVNMKQISEVEANAEVETVLGSIPASSDTVESEGQQMNQC